MTDFEKVELAFDILEAAEVMQEFDNDLWIKVDRAMWNEFNGVEDDEEDDDEIHSRQAAQKRQDC
jgi:hypothetical protein